MFRPPWKDFKDNSNGRRERAPSSTLPWMQVQGMMCKTSLFKCV